MRRGSYALSAILLCTGTAVAQPVPVKPATPPPPAAPAKPAPVTPAPASPAKPTPAPATPAPVTPATPAAAPVPPAPDAPPEGYYVEPSAPAGAAPPPISAAPGAPPAMAGAPPGPPGPPPPALSGEDIYEPPPPGYYPGEPVYEPEPPPEPHHVSPRTALWVGVRAGYFIPFGNAYARGEQGAASQGVPWNRYVDPGPMFELDVGARLARHYNVFALWERAQLGSGSGDSGTAGVPAVQNINHGETDFWGVGLRASSDPDQIGFVTELAIGYRRARAKYEGGEVQFTDAPFEARLGIGADIRINPLFSLSPLVTVGVGSFGTIETVSGGEIRDRTRSIDQSDGHAWATFTLGGHFDLLGEN